MSTFQYAPSNPQSCVLLEDFHKFPVDPIVNHYCGSWLQNWLCVSSLYQKFCFNVDVYSYECSPHNVMIEMGIGKRTGYQPLFEEVVA